MILKKILYTYQLGRCYYVQLKKLVSHCCTVFKNGLLQNIWIIQVLFQVDTKYKNYELEVLLDKKSKVQANPLFMGDYFYFHFDWTSLQNSRQRAISVSSHNLATTLLFKMKSNFDETLASCSKYHYYQQQGRTFYCKGKIEQSR